MEVLLIVEDILQEITMRKLLAVYRNDITIVSVSGNCGNSYIKNNVRTFNEASRYLPHLILTDLDRKICAPLLKQEWINFEIHKNMLFRIAEKEIDAWILSDREGFARWMSIPVNKIPLNTQSIEDPKQFIINLARRSRKKVIKDIVPVGTAKQGPGYNILLQRFIMLHWDSEKAADSNRSLKKAIERIKTFLL
ncbi:MAG: hypothetical protein LBE91_21020 [Tannerella sp.]|jgi:hypothetical protein|nr:hypothetical protein [Tannerella sp.]